MSIFDATLYQNFQLTEKFRVRIDNIIPFVVSREEIMVVHSLTEIIYGYTREKRWVYIGQTVRPIAIRDNEHRTGNATTFHVRVHMYLCYVTCLEVLVRPEVFTIILFSIFKFQ